MRYGRREVLYLIVVVVDVTQQRREGEDECLDVICVNVMRIICNPALPTTNGKFQQEPNVSMIVQMLTSNGGSIV